MKLSASPELLTFFSTYFSDSDVDLDESTTEKFTALASPENLGKVLDQARRLLAESPLPLDELGSEANRWFGENEEAEIWLAKIVRKLEQVGSNEVLLVKDSNGATLIEGDSVQVIKDLKVKGGSSDLKRGTLIKKIHLTDDSEAVECRVEGSTLVLKTCFLKKV